MKLILLLSLLVSKVDSIKQNYKIDITDIIKNVIVIADKSFDKDFMNNNYSHKPWKIYNKFIDKQNFATILSYNTPKGFFIKKKCNGFLTLRLPIDSVSITDVKEIRPSEPFNFLQIQRPYYRKEEKIYTTIVWIRDKSWTSGFCVMVYFNIIGNNCVFVKGTAISISDIQEF